LLEIKKLQQIADGESLPLRQKSTADQNRFADLAGRFASASKPLPRGGVDVPAVMKLMGHSDMQTTMIYARPAPDHLADAANGLSFDWFLRQRSGVHKVWEGSCSGGREVGVPQEKAGPHISDLLQAAQRWLWQGGEWYFEPHPRHRPQRSCCISCGPPLSATFSELSVQSSDKAAQSFHWRALKRGWIISSPFKASCPFLLLQQQHLLRIPGFTGNETV
jgi:hypothetical protein